MPFLAERSSAIDRDTAPFSVALNRRLLLGVAVVAAGKVLIDGGRALAQGVRGAPLSSSQIEVLTAALADTASHGFGAEEFGQSAVANAFAARDPTALDQLREAIFA